MLCVRVALPWGLPFDDLLVHVLAFAMNCLSGHHVHYENELITISM